MPDPDDLPPRAEEDMAPAEDYRLTQAPSGTEFAVETPFGQEKLYYAHGQVEGFGEWHEFIPAATAHELARQIEELFKSLPSGQQG